MINILFTNVLRTKFSTFELILSRLREQHAIFTIKLISNNSNKHFVFHQEPIFIFFESNIEFKSTVMSAPSMVTFIAPELKETFFRSFFNLKLLVIPLVLIMLTKHPGKCFLWSPFDRNPFKLLLGHSWYRLHLNWKFAVNVVLNLFNGRVRSISILLVHWMIIRVLGNRNLKPISYFKNISLLQMFILIIRHILILFLFRFKSLRFHILPLKD